MNRQKLFDSALYGIIEQGTFSMNKEGTCAYFDGKNKCAIGHCLPEKEAKKLGSVAKSVHKIKRINTLLKPKMKKDISFLEELQRAHDYAAIDATFELKEKNNSFIDLFKENMKKLAQEYKLKYTYEEF